MNEKIKLESIILNFESISYPLYIYNSSKIIHLNQDYKGKKKKISFEI